MARKLRKYPGAIDHVLNPGDRREATIRDDGERRRFVETLDEKGSVLDIATCFRAVQRSGMDRKLRIEYPGAIDHVMNRGDRREATFRDDGERRRFVETLDEPSVVFAK